MRRVRSTYCTYCNISLIKNIIPHGESLHKFRDNLKFFMRTCLAHINAGQES